MPRKLIPLLKELFESEVTPEISDDLVARCTTQIGNRNAQQTALYYRAASTADLEQIVLAALSKLDSEK